MVMDPKELADKKYDEALARRLAASEEIERLKAIKADCDRTIGALFDFDEVEKVSWNHNGEWYSVFRRKGSEPRSTIDPVKLMERGVPAHVIQECTTYGEPGKGGITMKKVTHRREESDKED